LEDNHNLKKLWPKIPLGSPPPQHDTSFRLTKRHAWVVRIATQLQHCSIPESMWPPGQPESLGDTHKISTLFPDFTSPHCDSAIWTWCNCTKFIIINT